MAELVGGALLSGFVNVLFERMATREFLNFFQGKKVLSNLLDELKIRLLSANKLLKDAEVKQLTDENVKKWLDELKQVLYEADHVMDKVSTEALRRKVEEEGDNQSVSKASKFLSSISTFFSAFESTVKSEIEEILRRLKLLLDQNDALGLKEGDQKILSQRVPAPLIEESDVYGREKKKEAIIKLLLSDGVGSPTISVIGKTTLAQLVYNDSRVRECFDLTKWVTISEESNVFVVTKALFEETTKNESHTKELNQLQGELKSFLKEKKFLYVLDDAWSEDYRFWEHLQNTLRSGRHGSKIIVTTRSMIVASKMRYVLAYELGTISKDDCMQLFAKHVFDNTDFNAGSNLLKIGTEIVKKCKGLPLAIKSVAGVLCSMHPDAWTSILQSDLWKLESQENPEPKILPALYLSYHFLPAHLKRCFTSQFFPKIINFVKVK